MAQLHDGLNDFSRPIEEGFIPPEGNASFSQNIFLGIQHVFAMFGATVLGPLLMGFDPNTSLFFSGIATLIFYMFTGGRIPSYLGSSFSFISAVVAATGYSGVGPNPQLRIALGGIFTAGFIYSMVALLIRLTGPRLLNFLFPPVVTGSIVGVIGLNLARVAAQQVGASPLDVFVGIFTMFVVVIFAVYPNNFLRRIPLLIGAFLGYILYFLLHSPASGFDHFSKVKAASWLGLPHFQAPVFDLTAMSLIGPIAIILISENLGHVKAIGGMTHRNLDPFLWRAFLGDGVATMISSAGGGTGVTTYAENMGIMRISRNFSSTTLVFAAIFAILLSLSPKFGALLATIPTPVLGGLSIMMFGFIAATAGSIWQQGRNAGRVDFDDIRTLIIVGVTLVIGAGDLTIRIGSLSLGGIVTATIISIGLYHLMQYKVAEPPSNESDGNSPYRS